MSEQATQQNPLFIDPRYVQLINVRLLYASLWKPRIPRDQNGNVLPDKTPKFEAVVILPKQVDMNNPTQVFYMGKEHYQEAGNEDVGLSVLKHIRTGLLQSKQLDPNVPGTMQNWNVIDGDTMAHLDENVRGIFRLAAKNEAQPLILDADSRTELPAGSKVPYEGCYVNLVLKWYLVEKVAGVYADLMGVQYHRPGEQFRQRVADKSFFRDVRTEEMKAESAQQRGGFNTETGGFGQNSVGGQESGFSSGFGGGAPQSDPPSQPNQNQGQNTGFGQGNSFVENQTNPTTPSF